MHITLILAYCTFLIPYVMWLMRGFFLALPTLTGATVLQLYKHRDAIHAGDIQLIAIGFVVSFFVALAVVKAFMAVVTKHGFAPFAWYRIVIRAVALVALQLR